MTYITGSVNDPNPAAALYTQLATALTTAGYELVDTVIISSRTHKVWKSPAASNAENKDWYLDVAYTTTGTGSVWFGAFETYDEVAHTAGFGPFTTHASSVDATEFSRWGANKYALETNWTHISNNLSPLTCSGASLGYWVSVTAGRVIGLTSAAPERLAYCGLFDPYAPWKAKCATVTPGKFHPLITASLASPHADDSPPMGPGALTRVPPVATVSSWVYVPQIRSSSANNPSGSGAGGPNGHIDTGVSPYLDGPPQGDRIQIAIPRGNLPDRGHGAGWLYDVARWGTSTATATSRGDATTVNGDPWVLASATKYACFGFKAV